jgi:hypothetical protein
MYLPTKLDISFWNMEIAHFRENLSKNNVIHLKNEGLPLINLLHRAFLDINEKIIYLDENNSLKLKNLLMQLKIVDEDRKWINPFGPSIKFSIKEESFDELLDLASSHGIILITKTQLEYNGKQIVLDGVQPIIKNKLESIISNEIKDMGFTSEELFYLSLLGGDWSGFLLLLEIRSAVYKSLLNQLTTFQRRVLESTILFNKKTSKEVKLYVENQNSSSILDAIKKLEEKEILEHGEFKDTFFKYWLFMDIL